jgi:outer membrane protein assembly factor BamB
MGKLLALVLAAQGAALQGELPRAPSDVWQVAWSRQLVKPTVLEWRPREPGGPAVDPITGVVVAGTRDGVLHARTADGRALWEFRAKGPFPAPARFAGALVYAGSSDGHLYALELATGKVRWSYAAGEEVGTTPVVQGGVVYVSTLQDTLVALEADSGRWKWHLRREQPVGFTVRGAASPTVADGRVYAAFSDGSVTAVDAQSGQVRWQRRVAPIGQFVDVDSTPVPHEGRLYVAAYSGAIYALDAATGRQVWESRAPGASGLALAAGVLVAVTASQVLGVQPEDGQVLWTGPLDGTPSGSPAVLGGRVLIPNGRSLLWLDAATGQRLVTFDPGTGVTASAAVKGERVYVLSNGGALVALDVR